MPITPLHMGPALLGKAALDRRFSLIAFGMAQILMDMEPLLGLLLHWPRLHGLSHTLLMAIPIGLLAAWLGKVLSPLLLARWRTELRAWKLGWLEDPLPSRAALVWGGLLGSFSHLLLDALMHGDMTPLWPFSAANPLYELTTYEQVEWLCLGAGVLGGGLWVWRRYRVRRQLP